MTLSSSPALARSADERVDWVHHLPLIAVRLVLFGAGLTAESGS
jgi:hypothetical protein